jgi:hypothetical protein
MLGSSGTAVFTPNRLTFTADTSRQKHRTDIKCFWKKKIFENISQVVNKCFVTRTSLKFLLNFHQNRNNSTQDDPIDTKDYRFRNWRKFTKTNCGTIFTCGLSGFVDRKILRILVWTALIAFTWFSQYSCSKV